MRRIALGEICEKGTSNIALKDLENNIGKYPIYGASGLIKYVDFYRQEKDYIAIVKDGAGVGRTMLLPAHSSVIGTMQYIFPKDNINIKFLYYAITYMELGKYFSGATIPHIYFKDYQKEEFNVYELDEQKKIADILDKVTSLIDKRKEQLKKLDELVKARFVEMFGDPRNNPNSFNIVTFNDCVEYMGDIGSNGANKVVVDHLDMKDEEDYALMVRFLNFTKNDFTDDVKYVSKEAYDFFKKSQIFGGELIICKIGSAGQNYVMPYLNRPVSLGLNQIMVRINDRTLMPYLYQYLNTDYGKQLIDGCINGAVTKSITKTELKKIPVIVPPMELQQQFASFVEQTDKSKLEVQKSLEKLELLKKALMQKYFG